MRRLFSPLLLLALAAGCDPATPDDAGDPIPTGPPTGPFALAFTRVPVDGDAGPRPFRDVSVSTNGRIVGLREDGTVRVSLDAGATWRPCAGPGSGVSAVAFRPDGARVFLGGNGAFVVRSADCATIEADGALQGPTETFAFPVNDAVWFEDTPGTYDLLLALGRADQSDGALVYGEWNGSRWSWGRMVPNATATSPQGPASAYTAVGVADDDHLFVGLVEYRSGLRQPRLMSRQEGGTAAWVYRDPPAGVPLLPPAGIAAAGNFNQPIVYLYRNGSAALGDHWFVADMSLAIRRTMTLQGVDTEATVYRLRFDAEDRLWLATSRGLYRSNRAVTPAIE